MLALTLYNSLTDAEIKAILDYASICCGCSSRKYPKASLEHILRFWNIEKEPLFKMFGEKLILSKEVEIQKDIEDLKQEMHKNCIEDYDYFIGEYTDFLFEELLTTGCITNEQFAILVNIISKNMNLLLKNYLAK